MMQSLRAMRFAFKASALTLLAPPFFQPLTCPHCETSRSVRASTSLG